VSKHIILGDVHLGKSQNIGKPGSAANLNSRIQDQQNLLNWTLEQAINQKAASIIITGDVFEDSRPHPMLIHIFISWLKQCEKSGINVHVIFGNHDIIRTGSVITSALNLVNAVEFPGTIAYKDVATVNYPGLAFVFVPFRDRRMYDADSPEKALALLQSEIDAQVAKIPKTHTKVLVGHLSHAGSIYVGDEIDEMLNELFCPPEMFNDFDYVWMGHIHKPQVLNQSKPFLAHIGSMDRSDFSKSELDHDKIIVVLDTDDPNFYKEIIIPTRPLRKIEISVTSDKDTTDFVINYLHDYNNENSLKDAVVRLEIELDGQETPNVDRDKVLKFIYSQLKAHYVCNFSESRTISVVGISSQTIFDNNMSIPSAIDSFVSSIITEPDEDKAEIKKLANECYEDLKAKK